MMAENPDARLIASATELGLEIAKKFRRFPTLISLEAIRELSSITSTETEWIVGSAATSKLGSNLPAPFMSRSFLSLSPIPALKLTDQGLVDAVNIRLTSLIR